MNTPLLQLRVTEFKKGRQQINLLPAFRPLCCGNKFTVLLLATNRVPWHHQTLKIYSQILPTNQTAPM